jgi:hypothetical protein
MSARSEFTCIGWATPSYAHLAQGIRSDCERLGYRYHLYQYPSDYLSLVRAWCNHPRVIRQGVNDFGTVLFLDIECRLLKPPPPTWRTPLVSIRHPAQKFWIRYNSGTVIADESCFPRLDTWLAIIEDWRMGDLGQDDFVHWPGDLCDELALSAALAAHRVKPVAPELEYVDLGYPAEIARGLWRGERTIVQHPTIHHWPQIDDLVEAKKLFWQNFAGDPRSVAELFASGRGGRACFEGWVFDADSHTYAPQEFWKRAPRRWIVSVS